MKLPLAIDLFLGRCASLGYSPETQKKYRYVLDPLADAVIAELGPDVQVEDVQREHCELYVNRWATKAPATNYGHRVIVKEFFEYCRLDLEIIDRSPAEKIQLPKRLHPDDLDVVTVEDDDVGLLFAACAELDEFLTIAILAYTGVRRTAAANLRWRDLDFGKGTGRFREKGGKVIVKPLPDELATMLYQVGLEGQVPNAPDDYVIPNRRPGLVGGGVDGYIQQVRFYANKRPARNNKVVYNNVKRVAERAGVDAHPHALRAAFAVHFIESNPDKDTLLALKDLLGHSRIETTEVYLRRRKKALAMETVRPLSWGSVFQPRKGMPPAGFEPALQPTSVSDHLGRKLEELRAAQRGKARDRRR